MCFTVKHAFFFKTNHTGGWLWSAQTRMFQRISPQKSVFLLSFKMVGVLLSEKRYNSKCSLVAYQQNRRHNYWNVWKCLFPFIHQLFLLWVSYESRHVCHHWSQTAISWISSLSLLTTSASYSILFPSNCGCYLGSLKKMEILNRIKQWEDSG